MTVEEFNVSRGLYIFEFDCFETEFHSHPAIEIIIAKSGNFTLWTDFWTYTDLKFAVVLDNQKHKISSTNGSLKIIMIEHHSRLVVSNLNLAVTDLARGYFFKSKRGREEVQLNELVKSIKSGEVFPEYDYRISEAIEYLNQNDLEYDSLIKTLRGLTNLSESRLSHLFKSNVGISLRKYLIWTKLKFTIKNHLNSKEDLLSALLKSGFYDHPHFSRSFKSMLGVKPSKVYNSRNIQVLPIPPH